MIDPETARQAWDEAARRWCSVSDRTTPVIDGAALFYAGQALAVLVPQLLDQLARTQEKNDRQAVTVTQAYDKCMALRAALNEIVERDSVVLMGRPRYGVYGKMARAALGDTPPPDTQIIQDEVAYYEATGRLLEPGSPESVEPSQDEVPTPHDEEWKRKAMGYAQELITLRPELDALGERCHQLEAALESIATHEGPDGLGANVLAGMARAALGDTPGIEMEYDPKGLDPRPLTDAERDLIERAKDQRLAELARERGDAAVSPEPLDDYTRGWRDAIRGETDDAAVEPPQPETHLEQVNRLAREGLPRTDEVKDFEWPETEGT